MKKIFSLVLAIAMIMSVCVLTANAGTAGYYDVSYEAISVASGDVSTLAVGDVFSAKVVLKGADGLFGGQVALTWNDAVIAPVKTNNTDLATTFGQGTISSSRLHTNAKVMVEEENEDGDMVEVEKTAFESMTSTLTSSSLVYDFSSAQISGGFNDYPLTGDQTIIAIRFKVVGTGEANLSATAADTKVQELKSDGIVRLANTVIPTLTIGSTPEEDWKDTVKDTTTGDIKFPATSEQIGTENDADLTTDADVKKVVIFAKAVDALTGTKDGAANYGITIGGMYYPGYLSVPAGSNWSIILVDPNNTLTDRYSASVTVNGETKTLENVSFK